MRWQEGGGLDQGLGETGVGPPSEGTPGKHAGLRAPSAEPRIFTGVALGNGRSLGAG